MVTIEWFHNRLMVIYSFLAEKRLVEEVWKHDTLVVVGETGSGKTTRKSSLFVTFYFVLRYRYLPEAMVI